MRATILFDEILTDGRMYQQGLCDACALHRIEAALRLDRAALAPYIASLTISRVEASS